MKFDTIIFSLLLSFLTIIFADCSSIISVDNPKNYYINTEIGNDNNNGVSKSTPFESLSMLDRVGLKPGDKVYLAEGQVFSEPLILNNVFGSKSHPIIISTYSSDNSGGERYAYIKTEGYLNAVHIKNSSHVELENLSITAGPDQNEAEENQGIVEMRVGVLVEVTEAGTYEHVYLNNLEIREVFFESPGFRRGIDEVSTANGTQNYGWGIRFINETEGAFISDIKVTSSIIENVSHTGIKFTAEKQGEEFGIKDIHISGNSLVKTGGPGIQMSGVYDGIVTGNTVDQPGSNDDSRKWGRGSGLWTWSSSNILIEKNRFTNANGPGDSAGAHIDFNCSNIVLQYNFSANNAGGFCEILGNNYNCSYRYNISVNDGHRVKGEGGAFQEGKIFWLSGYNGASSPRKGPFNSYFYNNTIYVKESIEAKIAIDRLAEGILIANNIFHIEGDAKVVKGDQYNPESEGKMDTINTFFKNNLFLHNKSWPERYSLKDSSPLYGNVQFGYPGGLQIENYIPKNKELVKDRGVVIQTIPKDDIGLYIGLVVGKDILGNPIVGPPDLGAIEVSQ